MNLACTNLTKAYGPRPVLRGVTAQFPAGHICAIIGPSGTGKSTLLRVLSLLESRDGGEIEFAGQTYRDLALADLPGHEPWPALTTVFQQLFLWPHLTIRENILLPLRNLPDPGAVEFADQIIRDLLIESYVDRYPNQVSHGQRQRAAIARAIALRPRFLLLDEITSALDVEHVRVVLDYLRRLKKDGVGIVLVTHLIGFARDAADQVIFFEEGRILEAGTADILSRPKTTRLAEFLSLMTEGRHEDIASPSPFVIEAIEAYRRSENSQLHEVGTLPSNTAIARTDNDMSFAGEAVLASLRRDPLRPLDDSTVERLGRSPMSEAMLRAVNLEDIEWLLKAWPGLSDQHAGLFVSLLCKFRARPEVGRFLLDAWSDASPRLRCRLMWRILDEDDLAREWKEKILDNALENWPVFSSDYRQFHTGADSVLRTTLERLGPGCPPSKRWAYLCHLPLARNEDMAARNLLALFTADNDEFTAYVASLLLQRFAVLGQFQLDHATQL